MSEFASFQGKVAVITGSTQGLGEATARLFKARGIRGLIVTGRNRVRGEAVAASLTGDGCEAHFVQADLADVNDCRRIIAAAEERFDALHILVNCAALTERGTVWDTTPELFDRMMAINVRAPFFLMQEAIKLMERKGVAGSIVNISSVAAYGSVPMLSPYAASKAALNILTKNIAYSVMWRRIRVNALALGWMDTPGEDEIQRRYHTDDPEWLQKAEARQPFGRLLKPEEVARAIAFLASEESGLMTGSIVDFDQSVAGAGPQPVPPPIETWEVVRGVQYE
ncbi:MULTISPECIES: SDR family oxidoreductase [Caldilinea]|jgi:NAD(P)-dependent dehydrogenase (short-subunit alcohol dehydrogenase family)|uniref:Putative oxidoreductase n=2 Tax=Caldilinea TaxID=233191 RepID=I0I5W8_CALAS|nr:MULTISPECIES: SDR family oxidoreductase [Caldilinea]BAM00656.1 putative oxidoreductase [Caldilinea aerophila DSM 14535 = NBRC 104270]GIV67915.1 MAG: short-chain dehydrogenase [Caldilinea sp.]